MADSSTTVGGILNPIAGHCWARRQPHNGIGYASLASGPMNPSTLLRGVFTKGTLALAELDS